MPGIESLLVGRVLGGRYRIEEVIGRGGMGAVYRAVDERLGRQVALKVITLAGSADAESRERLRARFFREARSAAALPHHPNVVPVYDYGSDEALGLDYIVMELLRGSDLATRLSRAGPPPLAAALKVLLQAARGVAVGHRQGLIHRDIKPGNIFLTEGDQHEIQVRVVDFGIAKLADDEDTLAQLTQEGRAPHSPAHASPEQLRGLGQLSPASDVFSLGAVGFQLLTGERPFSEADRNRMSLGMPAEVPILRALNPAIPGSVETVIRKALAFDPEERHTDAAEFAEALGQGMRSLPDTPLEPYLAGAARVPAAEDDITHVAAEDDRTLLAPPPIAGEPPPRPAPAQPIPPRRPASRERGVGGILVWLLVILALGGAAAWAWWELQRAPGVAVDIPPPPDTIPIITPDVAVEVPAAPTELDAFINNREGIRYFELARFDSALVQFQRAVQISPDNPDYRRNYAVTLLRLGLADEAVAELERAIRLAPDRPLPYRNLAEARIAMGDTLGAIAAVEEHLERETDPVRRGVSERDLRSWRLAVQPTLPIDTPVAPPEPVDPPPVDPPPATPPPAPDPAPAEPPG